MSLSEPSAISEGEAVPPSHLEQRDTLLSTKLFIPLPRPYQVERSRLIAQISGGMEKALILISAPAGYGKTTLVSSWLNQAKLPAAWISLDEGDNDPSHFLQYLLSALHKVVSAIQVEMLSAFQGPGSSEALFSSIISLIEKNAPSFVIVLDDFHVIHAEAVLDMLSFLFEHSPQQMHTLVLSRTDPLLPLSRLRARNQLQEIRASQLRFGLEEITVFLNEVMSLKLSSEDLVSMQTRTEGWIAGLQLAAISMQACEDTHAFVTTFAGSHHHIIDYLTEEVLKQLPEDIRSFLLQTSILSRMCGPLCDAVVSLDHTARIPGQQMLEKLETLNLFLIPLDNERRWYRYHHLFADVLCRHLENLFPGLSSQLNLRASRWYGQNGFIPESIDHALLTGDMDWAIELIEQNGVLLLIHGEVTTILKWIAAVEPSSQSRPWFSVFKAWAYALSGDLGRVEGFLETAEGMISSLMPSEEVSIMQGAIAAARAYSANLRGEARTAAVFARKALAVLPVAGLVPMSLRAVSTSLLGDATSSTGDLEEARQAYIETAQICQAAGDVHLVVVINSNLANLLVEQGSLHQAARVYSETLSLAIRPDGQKMLIAGRLLVELSQVYYEWNRLADACQHVQGGLVLCTQWGNMDLQAVAYAQLASLEYLQVHQEASQAAAEAAERIVNGYDLAPRYSTWVRSCLARLSIRQGNLEHASHLVQKAGVTVGKLSKDTEIPYLLEPVYSALLRLFLAQKNYDASLGLSQLLLGQAESRGCMGKVIEILALRALIYQAKRDMPAALATLGGALVLAQPEGFARVFLDEGEPMLKLLYQARVNHIGGAYLSELLPDKKAPLDKSAPSAQQLVEPLTSRELELMQLIEQGCSNQDISDRLVISIPTVKRHISNIYSKLGAKNRTQAISLAKELNLLD